MLPDWRQTSCPCVQLLHQTVDREMWDRVVESSLSPDVYYTRSYVQAHEAAGHGVAAAVVVDVDGGRVLVPVLLRHLSDLSFVTDSNLSDGITAYGYGGLLLADALTELSAQQSRMLVANLRSWGRSAGLVSLLVRLHPILRQSEWLSAAVDETCQLHQSHITIAVRLGDWNESARCIAKLSKGRRSDLSVARRTLEVTWMSQEVHRDEYLQIFYDLYEARMDQIDAPGFYHFPQTYYRVLADELGDQVDVAIAWLGEKPVGASIFMADRRFAHYHLSATNQLGRANKASTLLINEGANWARTRGCEYLHLGGGMRREDGLFEFKKSFGGDTFQYSYMTIITDTERYQALIEQRLGCPGLPSPRPDFFPQYRA